MLSSNCFRMLFASRALLHPQWPSLPKAVTCSAHCMSTSFLRKDSWHSSTNLRAPGKDRYVLNFTNHVTSHRSCSTSQVKLNCWNCKKLLDTSPAFFCVSCKVVQPPDDRASYFTIMDCDDTFTLDTQKLQRRYLQLQRSLHPDNFSQKSVKEQEYSESQSALVNKAYKTLLKPLSRGLYMLELQGMRIEDGADPGADSDFLMELMEINEALDEAQSSKEADKIGQDTKAPLGGERTVDFLGMKSAICATSR
ncbi:iron-sulfur cluster co-chaperone protein HscB isoform X2 [Mugil cephalus]|uniref:iron-sulfur cluster co-chaperone protein HscB isoform X2 n=1 Tax=Mugil cephalus TaxID=48193 RepID=UPI001FB81804|nr:iron-sulfur cluster co-chaperone protein HscB isoform X2 [Mugil cephalus]